MRPPNNFLLVQVGSRFTTTAVPGQQRILLPKGSDDWAATTAELLVGTSAHVETDEVIPQEPVRQGRVLAVPAHLTADMQLCAGPWTKYVDKVKTVRNERGQLVKGRNQMPILVSDGRTEAPVMRTCADILVPLAVDDTIRFDPTCLTDETELRPGVYLIPYSAAICVVDRIHDPWRDEVPYCEPIAGYVMLSRVWDKEVHLVGDERVRYDASGLVVEQNVPPLPNEGVVAHLGFGLRGTTDKLRIGDHVVFHGYHTHSDKSQPLDTGHAFVENIAGTEYLCVRQDHILAVRTT